MLFSVVTGLAAGALHVIAGADHLILMVPRAIGKPHLAFKEGLSWGLGHSTGVLGLSFFAILAKYCVHINQITSFAELGVGISLLVVGILAIRSALGLSIHTHRHDHGEGGEHEHVHLHFRWGEKHKRHSHTVTSFGFLHGMAGGSHLLAVIPALALPPFWAFSYMCAYLLGSILAMAVFVLAVSYATFNAGHRALSLLVGFTGGLSFVMGIFWIQKTSLSLL